MGFFDKLKQGLGKTKNSIDEKINNVFSVFRKVDEELLEELEEVLVMSDIGMETSVKIIDELRQKIKKEKIEDEKSSKGDNEKYSRCWYFRFKFNYKTINTFSGRSKWCWKNYINR